MKRHLPLMPASRLFALYAIIALAAVAYSCYVPIDGVSVRQAGWTLDATLLHQLFGKHAAIVGSIALGLAFYGGIGFVVSLPASRKELAPKWVYLILVGFIGYLCYFGYTTIFGK